MESNPLLASQEYPAHNTGDYYKIHKSYGAFFNNTCYFLFNRNIKDIGNASLDNIKYPDMQGRYEVVFFYHDGIEPWKNSDNEARYKSKVNNFMCYVEARKIQQVHV
jgi:hypothetical protein